MSELSKLEPRALFKYFDEICRIPHGSGNTDAIAKYCTDFADDHKLQWYRDEANNVIIRKPASKGYENSDTIILQGHIDMVCEKNADVDFDFTKDAISAYTDGDYIRAKGTTLGGDNGIAVAMMLAILDDDSLDHPPLEILLTADEEIGMVGAFALDCSKLTGHKLLNLDSEYEGSLMCSCAGGLTANSVLPVKREKKKLQLVKIEISGLTSGHSGVEIDKGRANSNVLMARLLYKLAAVYDYQIAALEGGSRETAIASASSATLGIRAEDAKPIAVAVDDFKKIVMCEYASTEPGMAITFEPGMAAETDFLTAESTKLVCKVLAALPDSVQEMSIDMPGLVQTSSNFGILKLDDDLTFVNSIRSSMTSKKKMVFDQIAAIVDLAGGETTETGNYPGWAYNPNSKLKDTIVAAYEKITGKQPAIEAVHAGIECGLFADSIENLDCVSLGPDMGDVHTPNECLSISSSARTFELLKMVLKESL